MAQSPRNAAELSRSIALVAALLAVGALAGCGENGKQSPIDATRRATTPTTTATQTQALVPSCRSLSALNLARAGVEARPSRVTQLARSSAVPLSCADVFIDSSGGVILELREAPGGARRLAAVRQAAAGSGYRPEPLPGYPGGFVTRQELAFLRGSRVVILDTGYSPTSQLQVSTRQMRRLATTVAGG